MMSFDYRLNPLYPIKECLSCGALYTTNYYFSVGILGDKIICDLDKTPDLSQRSPQNFPKCGNLVYGHYCQGCDLLRKKFKEDLFVSCVENGILQDSFEPSNENSNIANALREPFLVNLDPSNNSLQSPPQISNHYCYSCGDSLEGIFCHQCTCKLCGNGAHYGYNCSPKVPIIPDLEPFNNQTIKELPPTMQSFDPKTDLVHNSPNVFSPSLQPLIYSYEFCRNDAYYGQDCSLQEKLQQLEQVANLSTYPSKRFNSFCYDDDDEDYAIAVTPSLSTEEPNNSLSMGDEHLDTILATESDEFIKSSVENLVPIPSESEGESECDVPVCEAFTTFSNIHFDAENDFYSSDDQSFYDEDIDSLFDAFVGELTLLKSIPLGIDETDCYPEEETHFIKRLLYDNSSPRPPKELFSANSDTEIESFSPSPISVEDSDSLMEEIDLSFTLDYPMPPGIEEDDYDSERDILILKDFLTNDTISLPEIESFHFDIPSLSRPLAKPPDGNTGILNVKIMGDISVQKVPMPGLRSTLVLNQEKSPDHLSHLGHKAF
nr:hypothetical protein [Tanacetum cinerariifolium]